MVTSPTITLNWQQVTSADVVKAGWAQAWLAANKWASVWVQAWAWAKTNTYTAAWQKTTKSAWTIQQQATTPAAAEPTPLQKEVSQSVTDRNTKAQTNIGTTKNTTLTEPQLPQWATLWTTKEKQTWKPDNKDIWEQRQTEIINNLNSYYTTNQDMFSSEDAFKKNFQYTDRAPEQQQLLKSRWDAKQTENKNLSRINQINSLSWDALAKISDADAKLIMNTDKYKEYLSAKQNLTGINALNWDTTETASTVTWVDKLLADMWITYNPTEHKDLQTQYDEKYTKDVAPLSQAMIDAKTKVDEYKRSYENTLLSVQKEYAWTWVTDAFIKAMAAKKQQEQLPQYQNAIDNYNTAMTAYNNWVASLDKSMAMDVQQSQIDAQEFTQKLQLYQAARQQDYQKQTLEAGKFTAIADWFWWITILNTKTWEYTSWGSSSTPTSTSTSTWWWITNTDWNWYTIDQKKQIIAQMEKIENQNPNTLWKNNNPTALTRPSTKAYQDILKQYGWTPSKASNGFTYVKFPTKEQWIAWTIAYIDKAWLVRWNWEWRWSYLKQLWFGWGGTISNNNLWYQKWFEKFYQNVLDWKWTFKDAVRWWYKWTLDQFSAEKNAYDNRIANALQTVWVNKDDFDIKVITAVWALKLLEWDKANLQQAIYNKIVADPSLAKPENASKLWTVATDSNSEIQTVINWLKTVQSDWKKMTDEKLNTTINRAKYWGQAWTVSAIPWFFWVQATGTMWKFIASSKLVAQFLAKLVEKWRLSDQDRVFYQTLMPQINTPTYADWLLKIQNINDILLNQWAPWSSWWIGGGSGGSNDWM